MGEHKRTDGEAPEKNKRTDGAAQEDGLGSPGGAQEARRRGFGAQLHSRPQPRRTTDSRDVGMRGAGEMESAKGQLDGQDGRDTASTAQYVVGCSSEECCG